MDTKKSDLLHIAYENLRHSFLVSISQYVYNKTITEFGFRIIWRIMEISEGVICLGW